MKGYGRPFIDGVSTVGNLDENVAGRERSSAQPTHDTLFKHVRLGGLEKCVAGGARILYSFLCSEPNSNNALFVIVTVTHVYYP